MGYMTQSSSSRIDKKQPKKADHYDDDDYNYLYYWDGRDYENASERIAITTFLRGKHFRHAADVGGGYGRLCVFLKQFADKVTLAEPSQRQLDIGKDFLKDHPEIDRMRTQADALDFDDKSLDLITMIRVMHYLPDPQQEFRELARVLADDGTLILEVANHTHARNRLKYLMKGQKIPTMPVDISTKKNRTADDAPFVNHHPKTVIKQLADAGLKVEKVLSVSNLRSPGLKKLVPMPIMLSVEKFLQRPLARAYFGPSVFMLVKKAK